MKIKNINRRLNIEIVLVCLTIFIASVIFIWYNHSVHNYFSTLAGSFLTTFLGALFGVYIPLKYDRLKRRKEFEGRQREERTYRIRQTAKFILNTGAELQSHLIFLHKAISLLQNPTHSIREKWILLKPVFKSFSFLMLEQMQATNKYDEHIAKANAIVSYYYAIQLTKNAFFYEATYSEINKSSEQEINNFIQIILDAKNALDRAIIQKKEIEAELDREIENVVI